MSSENTADGKTIAIWAGGGFLASLLTFFITWWLMLLVL